MPLPLTVRTLSLPLLLTATHCSKHWGYLQIASVLSLTDSLHCSHLHCLQYTVAVCLTGHMQFKFPKVIVWPPPCIQFPFQKPNLSLKETLQFIFSRQWQHTKVRSSHKASYGALSGQNSRTKMLAKVSPQIEFPQGNYSFFLSSSILYLLKSAHLMQVCTCYMQRNQSSGIAP